MRFLEEVDAERFDSFVESHPLGTFQQCSAWGGVKEIQDARAYRVGLEEGGRLRAAALLLSIPMRKVPRLFLWAPRGLIVDYHDQTTLTRFAAGIGNLGRRLGAVCVRIDPFLRYRARTLEGAYRSGGEDNRWLTERLAAAGFEHTGFDGPCHQIQPRFVMWLDLHPALDDLFRALHPKTRYNIGLARRRGLEIVEGGRDDLGRFEAIMAVTGERDGFKTKSLEYFEHLWDGLAPQGRVRLFLARYDLARAIELTEGEIARESGRPGANGRVDRLSAHLEACRTALESGPPALDIAGAIAVRAAGKVAYVYGASDNVFRDLMPNYLLQWEMICRARAEGAELYDFRGSGRPDSDSSLQGLYRFKKGFNGEFVELIGEFDMVLDRAAYQALFTEATEDGARQKKLFKALRG